MVMFFTFTSLSAPTLGVITGGSLIHHYGGYSSPIALKISCLMAFMALAVGVPVPFVTNFIFFFVLIWLLLFFGGFIVPVVTGILLISVKPHERTIANSLANLSYNLFGYLPAPFVYGFICTLTGGNQSHYGMIFLMFMTVPASIFLLMAYIKGNEYESTNGLLKDLTVKLLSKPKMSKTRS